MSDETDTLRCPLCKNQLPKGHKVCCGIWHETKTPRTPRTVAAVKDAMVDNPHSFVMGDKEAVKAWQFMASRLEEHSRQLETKLAELEQAEDELKDDCVFAGLKSLRRLRKIKIAGWDLDAEAILISIAGWNMVAYGQGDTLGDIIDRIDRIDKQTEDNDEK